MGYFYKLFQFIKHVLHSFNSRPNTEGREVLTKNIAPYEGWGEDGPLFLKREFQLLLPVEVFNIKAYVYLIIIILTSLLK